MSTFQGIIKEIPGISVDRFDNANLDSDVYFLSHCHSDHMVGLNTTQFKETLLKRKCFIYVSHVTKAILKQLHPDIESQIKELDFHAPTPIYLKNGCVSVLPIPSGHCPGSVMFLFEGHKTILYTGDYRMKSKDFKQIKAFHDSYGVIKNIHGLYLDTTFLIKEYLQFPTREQSLEQIVDVIKDWIDLGENKIIHLKVSAKYGYEYVFMEIFNKIKMPIHVNEQTYNFYSLIPKFDGVVTVDDTKSRIHCNCGSSFNMKCKDWDDLNVRTIKLSAMKWKNKELEEGITNNDCETHFVCYSTHASYTEGVELITFLQPKEIVPCVLRFNELDEQIMQTIRKLLEENNGPSAKKPKLFNLKKIRT